MEDCAQEHIGESCHRHRELSPLTRWLVTAAVITMAAVLLRPPIARQVIVRGDGYLNYGMFQDAVRQYRKAIFIDPRQDRARNWLGYALQKSERTEEAIRVYRQAIEINPDNVVAWHDLGLIYAGRKEFEQARDYFAKAVEISSRENPEVDDPLSYRVSSLRFLGLCQERLGEFEEAISTFQELLAVQPEDGAAKRSLARLKNKSGGK